MIPQIASALMPFTRLVDPERAHNLALVALRCGLAGADRSIDDGLLEVSAFGRILKNPIGLAAGFDKNAVALGPLSRLGFGFVECGTVTPRPQEGNPRPRMFRLPEDQAVINRMGMNNHGVRAFVERLAAVPRGRVAIGANVGINKEGADPVRDYPALVAAVAAHADYIVINVSSPNTPGLRDLQGEEALAAILAAIEAAVPVRPNLLVKIAPDLGDAGLEALVECAVRHRVDGLIVSNTTISRPDSLRSELKTETGGLSGRPLFELSTAMLRRAYRLAQGRLTLIGCGGVSDGASALAKIEAGASLVQLYAAFAYAGPALIPRMKAELAALLRQRGYGSVSEAVGVTA
jgi:dihydroorotate dehydrogenase